MIRRLIMSEEINGLLGNPNISNLDKYLELRQVALLGKGPNTSRLINFDTQDEELNALLVLLEIELILEAGDMQGYELEVLFKMVQQSTAFPKGLMNFENDVTKVYLRVKYNDLYNDYQYLFSGSVETYKFMELVNKKLTTLSNIPDSDDDNLTNLVAELNVKVIEYCLLAGADFRKKNILKFIDGSLGISEPLPASDVSVRVNEKLNGTAREVFKLISNERFVLYVQYEMFVNQADLPILKRIAITNLLLLVCNFLENNIALLPKYYTNIHLNKIVRLFMIPMELDVESIVAQMIVDGKLPLGTCIDQMNETIIFGDYPSDYDSFDTHIKGVCDMVENISSMINNTNI